MKILVIDDLRIPLPRLEALGEVWVARTSAEALALLQDPLHAEGFQAAFFDHDLGGEDTARPVVTHLEEVALLRGAPFPLGRAFLHTSNVAGAAWMEAALAPLYPTRRVFAGDWFTA